MPHLDEYLRNQKIERVLEAARAALKTRGTTFWQCGVWVCSFDHQRAVDLDEAIEALEALDAPEPKKPRYKASWGHVYDTEKTLDLAMPYVKAACMSNDDAREYADWLNSRDS